MLSKSIRRVFLGLAVLVLASAYASSYAQLLKIRQEIRFTADQVEAWQSKNREVAKEIAYLKSNEYIERVARDKLGLVMPGEVPVVVCESPSHDAPPPVVKRPRDSQLLIGD